MVVIIVCYCVKNSDHSSELCPDGSEGDTACGDRICLTRNVPGQPSYVCVCDGAFEQGIDCVANSGKRLFV